MSYLDIHYQAGRCHLFAIALAELQGGKVTLLWDDQAYDDDMNIIHESCLVHAYIVSDDQVCDVEGWRENDVEKSYPVNSPRLENITPESLLEVIEEKRWPAFEAGEKKQLMLMCAAYFNI